jgi:invasion protein IalB
MIPVAGRNAPKARKILPAIAIVLAAALMAGGPATAQQTAPTSPLAAPAPAPTASPTPAAPGQIHLDIGSIVRPGEAIAPGDIAIVQRPFGPWTLNCSDYLGIRHICRVGTSQRGAEGGPVVIEFNQNGHGEPIILVEIPQPIDSAAPITLATGTLSLNVSAPACNNQICVFVLPARSLMLALGDNLNVSWTTPIPAPHSVTLAVNLNGLEPAIKAIRTYISPFPAQKMPLLEKPTTSGASDAAKKN